MDFCAQLPALLIENLTQIMGFLDAGFEVCGLCWGGDRKYIKDRGFRGGGYLKAEGERD